MFLKRQITCEVNLYDNINRKTWEGSLFHCFSFVCVCVCVCVCVRACKEKAFTFAYDVSSVKILHAFHYSSYI